MTPSTDHPAQQRLIDIWRAIESDSPIEHTSVVVPSLSFDEEELLKIPGAPFYEERLLFSLIRLRHPRARVLYVTSQPIPPEVIDYYLRLLAGVPERQIRDRFQLLCLYDGGARALTAKILERPRVIERIRDWLGETTNTYLTCFNSTPLERELADRLGIPLNGVDPSLLWLGSKSGSRQVFESAGVSYPLGFEDLRSEDQVIEALSDLARARPGLQRAVLKLNHSFAGAGNALFTYPRALPEDPVPRRDLLRAALQDLRWSDIGSTYTTYLRQFGEMGGIVEEFLEADEVRSPSVQMRIHPDGQLVLVSTHDQILGGAAGQTYSGCRFPASSEYRELIQAEAWKIGEVLRSHGVISRFGIDFMVTRNHGDEGTSEWRPSAIEINLRMGGTTPPFLALQFLTGGQLDQTSGRFLSPRGQAKFYRATDTLTDPRYRGFLPDDLLDILMTHGLHFQPALETGILCHMIGALPQFGKIGVTCIGNSPEEADSLFERLVETLDSESRGTSVARGGRAAWNSTPME